MGGGDDQFEFGSFTKAGCGMFATNCCAIFVAPGYSDAIVGRTRRDTNFLCDNDTTHRLFRPAVRSVQRVARRQTVAAVADCLRSSGFQTTGYVSVKSIAAD